MIRRPAVRSPPLPAGLTVTTISVMRARNSCLRCTLLVVGASNTARRSAPATVIQAASCSVRVTGRRACWAASWLLAVRTAASLASRAASRVRATSRFSGSTLSYWRRARPASKRARSAARSNTARSWRWRASESLSAWMVAASAAGASAANTARSTGSSSRRPATCWQVFAPYICWARPHLYRRSAVAVVDLHEPPAPAAPHQALKPAPALPRGTAALTGRDWPCWRPQGGLMCLEGFPSQSNQGDDPGSSPPTPWRGSRRCREAILPSAPRSFRCVVRP